MGTVPMGTGEADRGNVAAGGEIHDGVGAIVDGAMELFEFVGDIRGGGGISDVGVDLAEEGDADAHGLEIAMMNVGGNDGASAGNLVANEFGREFLALGDVLHFLGDDAPPRKMHLRKIMRATIQGSRALFDPAISESHDFPRKTVGETRPTGGGQAPAPQWAITQARVPDFSSESIMSPAS
jgi:hypothetical protein